MFRQLSQRRRKGMLYQGVKSMLEFLTEGFRIVHFIVRLSVAVLLTLLVTHPALAAGYPSALKNQDVGIEIVNDPDRMVPRSDWFSGAVDGQTYLRALGIKDFYHGVGYWIQARTEFRPHDFFRLNVRSIFFSGSFSGGYTEPTGNYHLFSFYGRWPEPVAGGQLEGRAMDIDRQTIGNGLMIEEKEMAGIFLKWNRDGHSVRLLGEGTGGLLLGDDLANLEFQLYDGYFGAGILGWTASDQSGLAKNRAPLYYLTSSQQYADSGFGYISEIGSRHSKLAGLLGVRHEFASESWIVKSQVQARHYADGFGDEFVGAIQHMYVSYDQYDKRYTNAANVFVFDDGVEVYSLIVDLDFEINQYWSTHFRNEVGIFDFKLVEDDRFYFYRAGISYYPLPNRKESLTLFASNKVLTDSYSRPPRSYSSANLPLFHEIGFLGFEAAFKF